VEVVSVRVDTTAGFAIWTFNADIDTVSEQVLGLQMNFPPYYPEYVEPDGGAVKLDSGRVSIPYVMSVNGGEGWQVVPSGISGITFVGGRTLVGSNGTVATPHWITSIRMAGTENRTGVFCFLKRGSLFS